MPFTPSDDASCGDLLCREDASVLAGNSPGGAVGLVEFPDESDESIAGFIAAETDYSPGFDYPDRFRSKSLDSVARQEAVAWILKVHVYYGFRPLTAYLAVNYLDRFLSSHRLPYHLKVTKLGHIREFNEFVYEKVCSSGLWIEGWL
ncbi:hypothetical protein C4D60_Mb10t00270 [Musa balbisiana]|uniref:Cyclin N-terminal domain-containing protein n=1 Tax=Musa balbisiana TaxID=52838 RepID=A0A4S8ITQ4_MUSBA|nr:hypothetical protein C4D60_Mb10t00270 [Musa balbisiana]